MQRTQASVNDFLAGNADNLLDYISEDFSDAEYPTKAALGKGIEDAKKSGLVAALAQFAKEHDAQLDIKSAKVIMNDKNRATVTPIVGSADVGSITVGLLWQKDKDNVWRIRTINAEGLPGPQVILGFFGIM